MNKTERSGMIMVLAGLALLLILLNTQTYKLNPQAAGEFVEDSTQLSFLQPELAKFEKQVFSSKLSFASAYKKAIENANAAIETAANKEEENTNAEEEDTGVDAAADSTTTGTKEDTAAENEPDQQNDKIASNDDIQTAGKQDAKADDEEASAIEDDYTTGFLVRSARGPLQRHNNVFLFLIIGLFTLGSLLVTFGKYAGKPAGIKNNDLFKKTMTTVKWPAILTGMGLIFFYVILYWFPYLLADWILLVTPLKNLFKNGPADENFLYGLIYSLAVLLLGIKMFTKYRHSNYQRIRTVSVTFFQLSFAFIIPEILAYLKKPAVDLKNIWPLDYTFFYDSNINELLSSGKLGVFMLVWGIALLIIIVPLFTYFFGKRWYCSWVCGCGGLAETAGDSYRHLSSKKLSAWKMERIIIYSVLVVSVVMTTVTLINYFSNGAILGTATEEFQKWYGFFIGSIFAGVIGTGLYPIMGSRVWCRFGCPLAAIFGIIQRYKSRFRITTNGGQCISCGNCSVSCEMGIDVRWYAQRQQNIVRSSCVGCGICAEVCPRGVLKLENGKTENRINNNPIIIGNDGIHVVQ
jgi:ferredoxin-type protein NapH